MKHARLIRSMVGIMVKDRVRYPGRLIMDTFIIIARCGVLLLLYWYIFSVKGGEINGITYTTAAWSMFLYFAFMTLRLRDISMRIMDDVKTGAVEQLFAKPVNYLLYRMSYQVGAGLYPFLVIILFGSFALGWFLGFPDTMQSIFFLGSFLLVFLLSAILSLLIYAVVGLAAFWIEDILPIFWIVDKAVMILGGSYLPVALFPALMYQVAIWSPFGASQFITHTVYETWSTTAGKLIGISALWVAVFALLTLLMASRARKRVSLNGG